MKKFLGFLCGLFLVFGFASAASATSMDVYAYDHSIANNPLDTGIDLSSGDLLAMSAAQDDTWGAGAADRVSNANGLGPANSYGGNYGLFSYAGFSFYYGSLIGRINGGDYFFVGTDFQQVVSDTGRLFLMYWDSNYRDNFGEILVSVDVNSVPEPATMLLLGAGLLGIAGYGRKKIINK